VSSIRKKKRHEEKTPKKIIKRENEQGQRKALLIGHPIMCPQMKK
jgi:hypothetical protein